MKGDWWAIKGLNCGETEEFPGGYDAFPCQHERWSLNEDGQWQNKYKTGQGSLKFHLYELFCFSISFCAGKANKCISHGGGAGIKTVANASINSPGVITHSYDSALSPQIGSIELVMEFFLGKSKRMKQLTQVLTSSL